MFMHRHAQIKLNPFYLGWFHHAPFLFHLKQGDYENALAEVEKYHMPEYFISYMDKAIAAGLLGRKKTAGDFLNRAIGLYLDFANHPDPDHYAGVFVLEEGLTTVYVESVAPIHHILDDDLHNFAFGFEHFEHFIMNAGPQHSSVFTSNARKAKV